MPTFDLSKTIEDVNGDPMFGDPEYIYPQDGQSHNVKIIDNDLIINDVVAILKEGEPLTYRKLIFRALFADVPKERAPEMPSKEDRAILAREIELNKTELSSRKDIPLILKAAENAPQITTQQYMRLMVFLEGDLNTDDPEEDKRVS